MLHAAELPTLVLWVVEWSSTSFNQATAEPMESSGLLEMLLFQNAAAKWTVATLKVLLLEVVCMEQLGVKEKKPG